MPVPRRDALDSSLASGEEPFIRRIDLRDAVALDPARLAAHVDLLAAPEHLDIHGALLADLIAANPATVFDLYLFAGQEPPAPAQLRAWREALPYAPGYLDRVAVYAAAEQATEHVRVSPRLFLVLPWTAQAEPAAFSGVARLIWRYDLAPDESLPLGAWRAAGGAGIWLRLPQALTAAEAQTLLAEAEAWAAAEGRTLWHPVLPPALGAA